MRVTLLGVAIGAMMASSVLALAQQTAPAVQAPAAPAQAAPAGGTPADNADDPNAIVCHPGEPILGSRFPVGRICKTRKEWDRIRRDSASVLFHEQMERSANCPPHTLC